MGKNINHVDFKNTKIRSGFWRVKQDMARSSTVSAVYDRFYDTGRIEAMACTWREGMDKKPHFFWDSDVAKWLEGAAYMLAERDDAELRARCESIIDDIIENQGDDGYYNIYYTVVEPEKRFSDRDRHELYCAGHLIEAAVAYFECTGERRFLDAMCKYADYIEKRFKIDRDTAFITPGHEEIELALIRLYECTGERRYLELSEFFINERGTQDPVITSWATHGYNQSHMPVREQRSAEGHAVRATYLYTAMAHLAHHTDDEELLCACREIFDDIVNKKMYITGGIGSSACGEAFTVDYDLPSLLAYSESCAAIGLVFFASRMLEHYPDSKYSDTIERVLYNGFLSSVSLDGRSFFYENPLETMPYLATKDKTASYNAIKYPRFSRLEVFNCSCCPPNIVRFIPSVANLIYGDDGETLYVHQFMDSETVVEREGGRLVIEQSTRYPADGKVKITLKEGKTRIAVRIPSWYKDYRGETLNGYAYFDISAGESLEFDFEMKPYLVEANTRSLFTAGKCALMRGPVVYCSESVDNGVGIRNIKLSPASSYDTEDSEYGVPAIVTTAYRRPDADSAPLYTSGISEMSEVRVRMIPYFAFANRGPSEMLIWHQIKM
ncbi:MAG: glycoside hydrolase family 127 protein [Clostridia bacterium]|nr:glycoside hydrolase family 127 protein [Clostridia bacterium]